MLYGSTVSISLRYVVGILTYPAHAFAFVPHIVVSLYEIDTPEKFVTGNVVTPSGAGGKPAVASEARHKLLTNSRRSVILRVEIDSDSRTVILMVKTVAIWNAKNYIYLGCEHVDLCSGSCLVIAAQPVLTFEDNLSAQIRCLELLDVEHLW